jgi:hypothetical protein
MKKTLLAMILLFPLVLQAEVLDRIAATVNTEVITESELNYSMALDQRLGNIDNDQGSLKERTLDGLVTRKLLVQEAHRLKFVEISDQERSAAIRTLIDRFASEKEFNDFLAASDITRKELSRMLGEQLLVERFVKKKVGLFVRVSRDEAHTYFKENAAKFRNRRFQDVQKKILARLTEQEIGRQLDQYLEELRGRADIRISAY